MGSLRTGLWLAPECLWNCHQSRCHKLQTCWNRREPEAGLLELVSSPYLREISRVLPVKDMSTNKEKDLLQCGRGDLRQREDQGHFHSNILFLPPLIHLALWVMQNQILKSKLSFQQTCLPEIQFLICKMGLISTSEGYVVAHCPYYTVPFWEVGHNYEGPPWPNPSLFYLAWCYNLAVSMMPWRSML